jgi:hypothetical protein
MIRKGYGKGEGLQENRGAWPESSLKRNLINNVGFRILLVFLYKLAGRVWRSI